MKKLNQYADCKQPKSNLKTRIAILLLLLTLLSCNGAYNKDVAIPINVTATGIEESAKDNSIIVSWDEVDDAEVYYIYRRDESSPEQTLDFYMGNSANLTYVDNHELDELVDYHYKVSSANLYGKKESSLSEEAVGWIKRHVWKLKDALSTSIKELQTTGDAISTLFIVTKNSSNELKAVRISYNYVEIESAAETEEGEEEPAAEYHWEYTINPCINLIGTATDLADGTSYDITSSGDTLYIAFADSSNSGKLTVKSLLFEQDEETEVITWTLDTVGSSGFSSQSVEVGPKITSFAAGPITTLAVGWIENNNVLSLPLGINIDEINLSSFIIEQSAVWSDINCNDLETELNTLLSVKDDTQQLSITPLYSGATIVASVECRNDPNWFLSQLNTAQTEWTQVGAVLPTTATTIKSGELVSFAGNIYATLNIDNLIKVYVFDEDWVSISTGFENSVSLKDGWDFATGLNLFYRDNLDYLRIKQYEIGDDWTVGKWNDRGRLASDSREEGVVDIATADFVAVESGASLTFCFWLENQNAMWAVLE